MRVVSGTEHDAFLSTLSLRRATDGGRALDLGGGISIHALLAESDWVEIMSEKISPISIHALLAESDAKRTTPRPGRSYFYPRSPCGERRRLHGHRHRSSTISIHALLAESDGFGAAAGPAACNFYPRSPCGERHNAGQDGLCHKTISIHALLAESDGQGGDALDGVFQFLSTLSLRRATRARVQIGRIRWHFYPRSPCGERRWSFSLRRLPPGFLSTLSLRRATT